MSLASMTGYGVATERLKTSRGLIEISAEIRTVNSKFLDISIRSPRPYIPLDSDLQKLVRTRLKRGRVDLTISTRLLEGAAVEVQVNRAQASALYSALEELRLYLKLTNEVQLEDLLKSPEWLTTLEAQPDLDEEGKFLAKVVSLALDQVLSARLAEGASLTRVIEGHRDRLGELLESIGRKHEGLLQSLRDRTRERVKSLFGQEGFDPHRLEQEIVLWVSRSDFQEELDRLRHHLETFDQITEASGEAGRRLEFLVQELQREVNTLGSKCPDAQVTPSIIEMKTSIERIREQIQNLE